MDDLEDKVGVLHDSKKRGVDGLRDLVNISQEQASKSVAAAVAAQEAAHKATEAAKLQHEAASSHMKACREFRRITELFCETGAGADVLLLAMPVCYKQYLHCHDSH